MTTEHISFLMRMRETKRAELAAQGERICAAFEEIKHVTSEEERDLVLSTVADEVTKFRIIQARA
jgi:hypothetical protein